MNRSETYAICAAILFVLIAVLESVWAAFCGSLMFVFGMVCAALALKETGSLK